MVYSIWIVSPEGIPFSQCFEEVAVALQQAFKTLGYDAPIVTDPAKIMGMPVVLGANLLNHLKPAEIPKKMIVYNLEQVHPKVWWFTKNCDYLDVLHKHPVWDFSRRNIEQLKQFGVHHAVYCGVGYMPILSRITPATEDIDVLFIGRLDERRDAILKQLERAGAKVHRATAAWGKARDNLIARAKIIINIHREPAHILEMVRLSYVLANRKCIVSESGLDTTMEEPLKGGIAFASYDKLVERCLEYLRDNTKRIALAEKGFALFHAQSQVPMLKEALERYENSRPHSCIYVQMASYRDPEYAHTLRDMFEKAAQPSRIFAGVCLQHDPAEDAEYSKIAYPRPDQVRVVEYHPKESYGAGWARNEAQRLWQGEEYVLQIHAHMRFEKGWDTELIHMLERAASDKPIITGWLPGYIPNKGTQHPPGRTTRYQVSSVRLEDPQLIHLMYRVVDERSIRKTPPTLCPSWVGNFLFARAELFEQVQFDPYIYFWGEEINFSARAWTHGWDFFQFDRTVLYHYWDRDAPKDAPTYRRLDNPRNKQSLERNRQLFGLGNAKDADAVLDLENYQLGAERSLEAYWAFYGVDVARGHVSEMARNGAWTAPANQGIFVRIAAYRDPECQYTIQDMFEKATHPERIFAGVVWQYDAVDDAACFTVPYPRPEQVREIKIDWRKSKGAGWARNKTGTLWRGEEYTLQIDSHMRFEPGWDETLIDMLQRAPSKKPVICLWPPDYKPGRPVKTPKHGVGRIRVNIMGEGQDPQMVHLTAHYITPDDPRQGLYPTPFWIGCFMFAPSSVFYDVPSDPYIRFWGDEISQSARLWTHGYDLFQNDRHVMYHQWDRTHLKSIHPYRAQHHADNQLSRKRVLHLLDIEKSNDPKVTAEIDYFGLGTLRPLQNFWAFCGINPHTKTATEEAKRGFWKRHTSSTLPVLGNTIYPVEQIIMKKPKEKPIAKSYALSIPVLPKIFVCITGPKTPEQVFGLFTDATHAERIKIALAEQVEGELLASYASQIRNNAAPATLWNGEDYVLLLHSSAQLVEGWDEQLIVQLAKCPAKSVLSSVLPESRLSQGLSIKLCVQGIDTKRPEIVQFGVFEQSNKGTKATPMPFISPHMIFMTAEAFRRVPVDPLLPMSCVPVMYGARLWTHGFTVYEPHSSMGHRVDCSASVIKESAKALRRMRHLLGLEMAEEGDLAISNITCYGHGAERDLDSFWRFAGIDVESQSVSSATQQGIWNEKALTTTNIKRPRIFVQIAAYRDPECQHTVKDLFDKASYPERVFVGICWQFVKSEDQAYFQIPSPFPKQVRTIEKDATKSLGACWARSLVQSLWRGEEFTFQIDSHMRFEPGWDEMLIAMLEQCEQESQHKAVLTTYPADYIPPYEISHRITHRMIAKEFDRDDIFTMRSIPLPISPPPDKPIKGAFSSACMLFGRSSIIHDVPYDPYLYFFGEEITLSVRLWTHGYDIYHPNMPVAYHFWSRKSRRTHFDDHEHWGKLHRRSYLRVHHLLGMQESTDRDVIKDIEHYGLGKARSLQDYQTFSGVNFKNKIIPQSAYDGIFPAPSAQSKTPAALPAAHPHQPTENVISPNPHRRKVLETPDFIVYDDFLSEQDYEKLHNFAIESDYEYINTHGKVKRVWDISNGFPLRGGKNVYYYAHNMPQPKPDWTYPSKTLFDMFIDNINSTVPFVQHIVGKPKEDWEHYSSNFWLYPPGTGLSMHDDGSGVYTGAYVYFLNPTWKPHWGGLLVVMDTAANKAVQDYKKTGNTHQVYRRKFLHAGQHNDIMMENGLAQCVFPKRNRMVFIHPDAFHMVTQVQPTAGDNVRMSIAGFFTKQKKEVKKK